MKKNFQLKVLFILLTLNTAAVFAQTAIDGLVVENIHGPSQIGIVGSVSVDINQDGLMDVVSASINDGHLRAYINQGNLEFDQQFISKDVLGAFRLNTADINSDGKIDFLIPSIETQEIIALIADSDSEPYGYRKQIIAEKVLLPTDAQAGDFNNDGLTDVVSISFEENLLLLHLQNGQNGFDTTILSDVPMSPRKLLVNDFNDDQQHDILLASSGDNSLRLFSNNADTTFNEVMISDQLTGIRYLAQCDLQNAKLPAFAAGVTDDNSVIVFNNLGNNQFSQQVIDEALPGADAVYCADFDGDTGLELASISRLEGRIYTYEIQGPSTKQLLASSRDGYVSLDSAVFENGARPLILTQAFFENRNLFYVPEQDNQEAVVWQDFPDGVSKVVSADINQDGVTDVVATSFRDDRVQWYDGTNNQHQVIAENIDGAADLVVADFNQDGWLDVVSVASFDNRFYWHENLGAGQFQTQVLYDNALFANSVAAADLNNDGKIDVIGTSATDDSVRWFEFTESGIVDHLIIDTNDAPNDVTAGDVDGDGDLDLVVPNFFSNDISYLINNGDAVFTNEFIAEGRGRPFAVLLYPSDDPNLLNVAATLSGDGEVILLEQEQVNQFQEVLLTSEVINPRKLDYDSLSKDLFITSPNDGNILRVNNFPQSLKTEMVVNDYLGVSDVGATALNSGVVLSGSFDVNSIIRIKSDLIYKNSFE